MPPRSPVAAPGRCPSAFFASNFFLGSGISPSRCAFLRASFRARRIASDFSRFFRSEGFSYELRCFISRNTPSRCIFFFRTRSAWSMLLSRTRTCKGGFLSRLDEWAVYVGLGFFRSRQAHEIFKHPGDQHLPPRILRGG